jgi:hypothetical protein
MPNPNPQVDPNNPQPTPANPNPGPARTPTPPETPQREVPPGVPSPLPEPGPGPEPIGVPPTTPTEIPATPTTLNVHRGGRAVESVAILARFQLPDHRRARRAARVLDVLSRRCPLHLRVSSWVQSLLNSAVIPFFLSSFSAASAHAIHASAIASKASRCSGMLLASRLHSSA